VVKLIDEFAELPGIGPRAAERLALHVLKASTAEAMRLAKAIEAVKATIRHCHVCFNLADSGPGVEAGGAGDGAGVVGGASGASGAGVAGVAGVARKGPAMCVICGDKARDHATILVVEQPRDLLALEQTGMYKGVYHVLLGRMSPLEGVGAGDVTIPQLLARVDKARGSECPIGEVIMGLNPTLEGDGTTLYIAEQLGGRGVTVSRLARGLPSGGTLEFASKAVLADAISGRRGV